MYDIWAILEDAGGFYFKSFCIRYPLKPMTIDNLMQAKDMYAPKY